MSTRTPRFTTRLTVPMRDATALALSDAATSLGITVAEALREATHNWLTVFHAPVQHGDTDLPEWSLRILQDESLSMMEKELAVWELVASYRDGRVLTEKDERMVKRELHRQFIERDRNRRSGLS